MPKARRDDLSDSAEAERFVRRQRLDAVRALRIAPINLFRPRLAHRPAGIALAAALLIVPLTILPNIQDVRIAEARANRDEAVKQAARIDEIAKELETKGAKPDDPRTRLATDLRDLAAQLRANPEDLKANLARLGSVEASLQSQLDPGNEQRSSALTSLSRSLSRAASGKPDANKDGDPKTAADDLKDLGDKLDTMTPEQRSQAAAALAGLQSQASQASGAAGQALRDAAQAIAQGQTAAARAALDKLGEALQGTGEQVQTNRDLARAASQLQEARRNLANASQNAGQQGQGQQGQGQQGQGQGQGQPGQSGQPGQGQGQGQGSERTARSRTGSRPRSGPRSGARSGPGSGPGPGPGSGPGSGAGSGPGPRPGSGARPRSRSGSRPGPGRRGRRRFWCPFARPGHRRQRPAGRPDQPEPSRGPRARSLEHRRLQRPRQAGRPVLRRRDRRRRPDPAGKPAGPGPEQRGTHAVPAGLHRLLRLRPDDARPELRAVVGQGLRPGLLQLA